MNTNTQRTKRKRRHAGRFTAWADFLLIVAICAVGPYFAYKLLSRADSWSALNPSALEFSAPELQVQATQYERKIYPYSIIRGGVRSREELFAHIRADRVVAEHYSGFDVVNARIIRAPKARLMYASYRIGDNVYWTANKIRIPLGELLITDGDLEARARCGNLLSDTEMTPLSGEEDPDDEFFDNSHAVELGDPLELFDEPLIPLTGDEIDPPVLARIPSYPPGYFPTWPAASGGNTNPPGTNVVPEPGTMVMVFTGLAIITAVRIRQRKR
jgi:hypothetical protein